MVNDSRHIPQGHVGTVPTPAAEQRFRDFAEISADWLWETDLDLRLSFVSSARLEDSGTRPAVSPGAGFGEFLAALGSDATFIEVISAHMRRGEGFRDLECQQTQSISGQPWQTWAKVSARPVTDSGGKVTGFRGVISDITERKNAEHALRQSQINAARAQTQLIDAIESISDGFAVYDADERLVLCNTKHRELNPEIAHLCTSRARLEDLLRAAVEQGMFAASTGFGEAWVQDRLAQIRRGGGTTVQKRASGRWIQIRERRTQDSRIVMVSTDVTEVKEREEALRREALIFEQMSDAVIITDLDGRVLDWSPSAEKMFGYSGEDMVGEPVTALLADEAAGGLLDDIDGHFTREDRWGGEFKFLRKNGSEGICEAVVVPLHDEIGKVIATVDVHRDISERTEMAEQLAQAQKMEALGQLTGGVAHDFNNLLTVIDGFAKLALRKPDDPERVVSCLTEVTKASEKAARLTGQLLAFSRKQVLEPKVIRLAELVGDLESLLDPLLGETIELVLTMDSRQTSIEVDPSQLSQAIINLAINARDAMPEGGRLEISAGIAELDRESALFHGVESGGFATITVADTGTGMDELTCQHIFEPFFTTKEVGRGTGLGLSMVYGMVSQSRGFIDVVSELGAGSVFTIYFPLVDTAPMIVDAVAPQAGTANAETVLLVEDEEAVLELAKMTLEELGYDVLTACNGDDAINLHGSYDGKIDLLHTDVVMPGLGGPEIAHAVIAQRPKTKVIYMSGYPSRGKQHRYEISPDAPFLQKPFDPGDLGHMVRQVLDS